MKRISPILLTLTIFVLVVCIGSILMVIPLYADMSQVQNTIDTLPPVKSVKTTSLGSQQSQLLSLKQNVNLLLPTTDQQYDLSVQVEALCHEAGVVITSMNFTGAVDPIPKVTLPAGTAPSTSTIPKLTISLSVQGNYTQIQQVVSGLTSLSRFIQINQLTLAAAQATTTGGAAPLTAQITAFAYYLTGTATPTPTPTSSTTP